MGGSIRNNSGNNRNYTEKKIATSSSIVLESSEDEIEEDSVHLAGFLKPTASDVESLSLFPFISQETIAMLQKELPSYLALKGRST